MKGRKIGDVIIYHEPERGASPWLARWRERIPGQKVKKHARSFATQAGAVKFAEAARTLASATANGADTTPADRDTVAGYLTEWLKTEIKDRREASTYRSYAYLVRDHITPHIGHWKLAEVKRTKVKAFYEDLFEKGVRLPTRKHVHACLSSAFGTAVEDDLFEFNPCLNLGRRLRHKGEVDMAAGPNPFTPAQAATFLDAIEAADPEWFEWFQFLHDTGVRPGEAAGLKWTCVDLPGKRAKIEVSYSPADEGEKAPKTHQRRWIDLTDLVVTQLTDLRKRQKVDAFKATRKVPAHVFTTIHGTPRRQDGHMRRVFARAITATKIDHPTPDNPTPRRHTPYSFRHTFATTHLNRDYRRLPWVSRQLGHETERTTVEYYFKYLSDEVTKQYADGIRG